MHKPRFGSPAVRHVRLTGIGKSVLDSSSLTFVAKVSSSSCEISSTESSSELSSETFVASVTSFFEVAMVSVNLSGLCETSESHVRSPSLAQCFLCEAFPQCLSFDPQEVS